VTDACLALVASSNQLTPIPGAQWTQFEDPHLHQAAASGLLSNHDELRPFWAFIPGVIDAEAASAVVRGFLKLEAPDKSRLSLAIQRLKNSRLRMMAHDKALEIGIAYEVMLSALNEGQGEHAYKLSMRAARFCGGTHAEKLAIRGLVKALYGLRSSAAHTGKVEADIKLSVRGRVASTQVLRESDALCTRIMRLVLERGSIPKWDEHDLDCGTG